MIVAKTFIFSLEKKRKRRKDNQCASTGGDGELVADGRNKSDAFRLGGASESVVKKKKHQTRRHRYYQEGRRGISQIKTEVLLLSPTNIDNVETAQ